MIRLLLVLLLLIIRGSFAGLHISTVESVPCNKAHLPEFPQPYSADSFLLSEGESLKLDCGVCRLCKNDVRECDPNFDFEGWTIQRSRYLGYGGSVEGEVTDSPFSLPRIRMSQRRQSFKFPSRVQLRVNEGERLTVTCPVRGPLRGPITWLYSYSDPEKLINLTTDAMRKEVIDVYGSPSGYLITKLTLLNVSTLQRSTRGRLRLDPGQSLVFAEVLHTPPNDEDRLSHLSCIHGNPHSKRGGGFSDWAGIIDIRVVPKSFAALFLGKLSQVVQLLIPFILACGTFFIVILTIHVERRPDMKAAAEGFTNKPPP